MMTFIKNVAACDGSPMPDFSELPQMGRSTRSVLFATAVLALAAQAADAAFISTSPDPMLGGDLVSVGAPISSPFGFATFTITDIAVTSSTINGGNNLITYAASPILSFYSDPALTNLLTTATLQGGIERLLQHFCPEVVEVRAV